MNPNSFRSTSRLCLCLALSAAACGKGDQPGTTADTGVAARPQDVRMKEGLALMYEKNDPFAAEQAFRDVLKAEPTHYGAKFQLPKALDREGKSSEARPLWEEMLKSAETIKDTATVRMVQARLASPDTVGVDAMVAAGVHYLYGDKNPAAAVEQFRKVLEKNPVHYGATYQLAVALDRSGKPAEAHPLWIKVLGMATTYKDASTEETARTRLKQTP